MHNRNQPDNNKPSNTSIKVTRNVLCISIASQLSRGMFNLDNRYIGCNYLCDGMPGVATKKSKSNEVDARHYYSKPFKNS